MIQFSFIIVGIDLWIGTVRTIHHKSSIRRYIGRDIANDGDKQNVPVCQTPVVEHTALVFLALFNTLKTHELMLICFAMHHTTVSYHEIGGQRKTILIEKLKSI